MARVVASLLLILSLATAPTAAAQPAEQAARPYHVRYGVPIPVRDGTRLSAVIVQPPGPTRPLPVVFVFTPYGADRYYPVATYFARRGYVGVIVDVRGRGDSEGTFKPYVNDAADGFDVIAWLARQPFSDGRVVMRGASYTGALQWQIAALQPPALKTAVPAAASYHGLDSPAYRGDADPAAPAVVREALDLIQRYFRRVHGVELPRLVAVRLAGTTSCPGSRSTGGATADTLCIWTGGPGWGGLMQRRSDALSLVAHEHVHNFQGQLGCLPAQPREYRWFTAGMAVHLSWRALIAGGAATETDYAAWFDRLASRPGRVRPIADYAANVADGDRAYARVTRAVRELADRSGGEDPAAFIARFDAAHPVQDGEH